MPRSESSLLNDTLRITIVPMSAITGSTNKANLVSVRFSDEELARLHDLCRTYDLPRATLIRLIVRGQLSGLPEAAAPLAS